MITIRARAWGLTVVSLVLLATAMGGASGAVGPPDGLVGGPARLAADAGTGILVSEVVTGGQGASDEFVELYNASTVIVDLTGLELVYASASGATISRKVVWTSPTQVSPGHHLLIANGAGTYAATADAVYSGGISSSGGTLALRSIGAASVDSLSWGDASGPLVEGRPGPAPPAASSLERLPGGALGNGQDTDDNAADTWVQSAPVAQGLADSPTPGPTPDPSQGPPRVTVAEARVLPAGAEVEIVARLTTPLGHTAFGTGAFAQDESAGIALELGSGEWAPWPTGSDVLARGRVADRNGQATVVLAVADDLSYLGSGPPRDLSVIETGAAGEELEARLVRLRGLITTDPRTAETGFAVDVDDGSGPLAVIAVDRSGVDPTDLPRGADVEITGVIGQRDSSGTGLGGYRLYLRDGMDVIRHDPTPTPTPSPRPTPTLSPRPTPTATSTPTPTPRPTPSPTARPTPSSTARPTPITEARAAAIGSTVTVRGTVTVETGRIVDEEFLVIQDATAGIGVRLAAGGQTSGFRRGQVLTVTGRVADPYGAQELRPTQADVSVTGVDSPPTPRTLRAADLSEATEGRLARLTGRVAKVESGSSGSFALTLADDSGEARVYIFGSTGAARERFTVGQRVRATGIVGQRESAADAGDGHRLWPRDGSDLEILAQPTPSATPRATPRPTPRQTPRQTSRPTVSPSSRPPGGPMPIAEALRRGGLATVEGTVTAPAGLLDGDGRRVTIQDASGAVLIRLPEGERPASVGSALRVTGTVGTYYGAPQLEVDDPPTPLGRRDIAPQKLQRPPAARDEWRLVSVEGLVTDVSRSGTAWRAELSLGGQGSLPVAGIAASGIDAATLEEGRRATVIGLVRRAYPTASDQRLAVVPRSGGDIRLGPAGAGSPAGGAGASSAPGGGLGSGAPFPGIGPGSSTGSGLVPGAPASSPGSPTPPGLSDEAPLDALLSELPDLLGRRVRVGGRVTSLGSETIELHDGTGTGRLRIAEGAFAADLAPAIGEVVNAVGTVTAGPEKGSVEVRVASLADITTPGAVLVSALRAPSPPPVDPSLGPSLPATPRHDPGAGGPATLLLVLLSIALGSVALGIAWYRRRHAAEEDEGEAEAADEDDGELGAVGEDADLSRGRA